MEDAQNMILSSKKKPKKNQKNKPEVSTCSLHQIQGFFQEKNLGSKPVNLRRVIAILIHIKQGDREMRWECELIINSMSHLYAPL